MLQLNAGAPWRPARTDTLTLPTPLAGPFDAAPAAEQALLFGAAQTAMLFDGIAGFLFVVKDRSGRYVSFNASLLQRLGLHGDEQRLRGRTAVELWPGDLSNRYRLQDEWVIERQVPLLYQLDPILLPGGKPGWCVTHKYPLCSEQGRLLGILCLSRDVPGLAREREDEALMQAVDRMSKCSAERLLISELADLAGLSQARFASRVRRIYGVSPMEFIQRNRVRAACAMLLHGDEPLLQVALACGFYDQAQFSRQFRRIVGMVPSAYRQLGAGAAVSPWRWDGGLP
ncbi:AraC family transcriptional regulator [Paucibacter sp. APW11]|uniref:AraC family transcriptional regulator n=1 Tax=Roseateles aquae TaxID=3077235 RepID=A0ABU3P5D2_9BURK|nr:AraC family transcriptional regulator [Paucibacter sp. APW11]MDT8997776.1 AraC family transcriptional regulator [Paucibacter sp. APW11]